MNELPFIEACGAIPSPIDIRDYKGVCVATATSFPDEFELPMPKVKNQGSIGSCVAHALATTIEYFNSIQGETSDNISVGFIYGNRSEKDHSGRGMIVAEALNRVTKCGSVTTSKFNKHVEVPEMVELVKDKIMDLLPDAYPNRFTSYFRINNQDAVKACLMEQKPVIFVMKWYSDIKVVNGVLTTNLEPTTSSHAMVIYGWNSKGWKIQNSWGTLWGNRGRAILPYNIPLVEMWGVTDTFSENQRQKREDELIKKVEHLTDELSIKELELLDLEEQLSNSVVDENSIQAIQSEYDKLQVIYEQQQKELQNCRVEIEELNQKLLTIKKPMNNTLGNILAVLVNFIINKILKKK